jgi:hypothetical protein
MNPTDQFFKEVLERAERADVDCYCSECFQALIKSNQSVPKLLDIARTAVGALRESCCCDAYEFPKGRKCAACEALPKLDEIASKP